MAYIKINASYPIYDGMPLTFKAPCDCTSVEGVTVTYSADSKSFVFKDAHGNTLTGIGGLFAEGAYVKIILDTQNGFAYIQNADTNAYLEEKFDDKASSSHKHSASDITSGVLPLARGGTGASTAKDARTNLGITPANIGASAMGHTHSASQITSGSLPLARGGTGYSALNMEDLITYLQSNGFANTYIETGSYEGTGYAGLSVSLSFSRPPKCVIVQAAGGKDNSTGTDTSGNTLIWVNGSPCALAIVPDDGSPMHPLSFCEAEFYSDTYLLIKMAAVGTNEFGAGGQTYNYIALA